MYLKTTIFTLMPLVYGVLSPCYGLEPLKSAPEKYSQVYLQRDFGPKDTDGDGNIQKGEVSEKIWKRFQRLDLNKNDTLEKDEFLQRKRQYVKSSGKTYLDVLYKKTEQEDLYLDIYLPANTAAETKMPVVIYTHGGGWAAGNKQNAGRSSFGNVHQRLLQNGFAVVAVNYRLWSKTTSSTMRDCVIDSKDSIRFISGHSNKLGIDPNRVFTFGDSAGGHLSQMLLLSSPDSFTGDPALAKFQYKTVAGVSWYGPCDFQDPQLFNHDDRENFKDRFGARILGSKVTDEEKAELYKEMSPVEYVTSQSAPLLMIQGDKDTTIPVKQLYRMQKHLKTIDASVELLLVKNSGHNWRSINAPIHPTREEIENKTVEFLVKHK